MEKLTCSIFTPPHLLFWNRKKIERVVPNETRLKIGEKSKLFSVLFPGMPKA